MNQKKIKALTIVTILIVIIVIFIYLLPRDNSSSITQERNKDSIEKNSNADINNSIENSSAINEIVQGSGDLRFRYLGIMPTNLRNKLPDSRSSEFIDYFYSKALGIAFTYEIRDINADKYIAITSPEIDSTSSIIYLHEWEKPKQSGQSIEVINIDPNLRFSTIPDIITQQILIADEKQGCRIEETNGRYTIKPKTDTQTCGNYSGGNNRFFVKPTEDGSTISKLIFVNAGSQELSYDGSGKGKYWYESVIVE